jgi:hypothetical protein
MTIAQTATTNFKVELPQGIHNFGPTSPDTFKVALYTAAANLDASTAVAANNLSGTPTAFFSFFNSSWTEATFTARGALIYNLSKGNRSVAVLDFGSDKTVNNDTFQIIFPTPDANSAIVRIS